MVTRGLTCFGFGFLLLTTGCALIADIQEPILDDGLHGADCVSANVAQVSVGYSHICARLVNGAVKCWGSNFNGELGLGEASSSLGISERPPTVNLGPGAVATHVEAGEDHTCAILQGGRLKCWGANDSGQLGLGDEVDRGVSDAEMGANLPDVDLGPGAIVKSVAMGWLHTCALLDDGTVKCWGDNDRGAAGLGMVGEWGTKPGHMGQNLPVVDLGAGRKAKAIAAGQTHTCALLDNDRVKCWGENKAGQLGLEDSMSRGTEPGQMGDALPEVDLGAGKVAKAITAGTDFTCALLNDDQVKCWGENGYGELGQGDTTPRGNATNEMGEALKPIELGGAKVKAIAAGAAHVCAWFDDSSVKCWGRNVEGQLGQGNAETLGDEPLEMGTYLPAVELGANQQWTQLDAGGFNACVLRMDGRMKCWGYSGHGQLGARSEGSLGDEPNEMGEALPLVELCASP